MTTNRTSQAVENIAQHFKESRAAQGIAEKYRRLEQSVARHSTFFLNIVEADAIRGNVTLLDFILQTARAGLEDCHDALAFDPVAGPASLNAVRASHSFPPLESPTPTPMTIIELYEHLTVKGYLPRIGSNVEEAYQAYKAVTGSPDSVWTQQQAAIGIMRQGLFTDYPDVFRCYYSGKRHRDTRVSWDRMLLQALQRWLDGDRMNPIDFLLQNP